MSKGLSDLYNELIHSQKQNYIDWYEGYKSFVTDIEKIRGALQSGLTLNQVETYRDTEFSYEDDPLNSFFIKLIYAKTNGIAARGQSVLSYDNLERFKASPDFQEIITDIISNPGYESHARLQDFWTTHGDKYNPVLINRILAACTTKVTTTVHERKFFQVFEFLQEEKLVEPYPKDKPGNWYHKNVFVHQQFSEILKGYAEVDSFWINIFYWRLVMNLNNENASIIKITEIGSAQPLNQILYGPPGTGKTYHTINEAIRIVNKDFDLDQNRDIVKAEYDRLTKAGQIVFTTFHQSMTYEDFVEGIKPQTPDTPGEAISYTIESGIFKQLCNTARTTKENNFDDSYSMLLAALETMPNGMLEIERRSKNETKTTFSISANSNGNLNLHTGVEKKKQGTLTKEKFNNYMMGVQEFQWWKGYFYGVIDYMKKHHNLKDATDTTPKKYVLIIDEINRGNVSAIFGELITLIEESKRLGNEEALEVKLPYSKEILGVPANLYIIGTMNTADRSIEALDTALRRRFSFSEMPPNPELVNRQLFIDNYDLNLKELLVTINNRVLLLLDKDHLIGHSFFMQVNNPDQLRQAFAWQIIPLLQEYFYGDYGKIALVLGEGFCKRKQPFSQSPVFAVTDYEGHTFADKVIYELANVLTMDDEALKQAIVSLLNK